MLQQSDRIEAGRSTLLGTFSSVREKTLALTETLTAEDQQIQSTAEASPTKWHLAHTTWFFETFVLSRDPGYQPFHPGYNYLFNSYYEAVGQRHDRQRRGMLTRPSLGDVHAYRRHVDERMLPLLQRPDDRGGERGAIVLLGINHEEQHQELILMDIKHAFGTQPLRPAFLRVPLSGNPSARADAVHWHSFNEGLYDIGHSAEAFCFDNEQPAHRELVHPFEIADRLVTCGEYLSFIHDGGYRRPELWLSEGWSTVQTQGWGAPLYWSEADGAWKIFTLNAEQPLHPAEPVCHVSYFEAEAYARWARARLPTEAEWEVASITAPLEGSFLEGGRLHPPMGGERVGLKQMFGCVWQWTNSAYLPYPGYRPASGALGEYNGKFMSGQMVLRGGSCWTPRRHFRRSYRNFFCPANRWQCGGIRLARDARN